MTDPIKLCHLDVGCIAYESCENGTCVVREAVAAEREACARIADETSAWCRSLGAEETAERIAAAIRARGGQT